MNPDAAGAGPERIFRIRPYLRENALPGGSGPAATSAAVGAEPEAGPSGPRPFVLTAGRVTGADPAIGLETQVTARFTEPWSYGAGHLPPEQQAIVALCAEPISVAEISAKTRLQLGVARVLVGDLRAAGHLDVHVVDTSDVLKPDVILRVIDGLRAIS
ncbi:DUF742 domain-containing protein [Micromonospora endophytica]|uniref:Uncharacterized protein n=1 Tax=Micromonospora endophytica TaxID=515350 RepID=A0A2W2D0U2_9ACTN|nr:DUF742 domain-containing protein [Micromonospora endophytica]PZF99264.1 hypothetical protein C1I93_06300 [Micromonospora endophytica]RIW48732.1 DUF742 domain-containing protein [Micromonospora endophytica]BCJ59939.1 hypothetical protein Jiend_33610 [Micromonospora endophytica]